MLKVNRAPLKLSAYTNQDSEGNAILKAHAYLAKSAGFISAQCDLAEGKDLWGFVGLTNDPAGAGIMVGRAEAGPSSGAAVWKNITFLVAKGEYFEITTDDADDPIIYWKSFGVLKKPVDFN